MRIKLLNEIKYTMCNNKILYNNKIYKYNRWGPHSSNLKFIYHNMRVVMHEFADSCQFVFTGSREGSEFFIPKILKCGMDLWGVDLQYYIDCHELGNR